MTTIGPSVSVFRANDTKPRMWVTVFELFSSRPSNGSVISTDQALSLNLKKIKIFFKPSGEVRFYSYDSKVDFSNSIYLHLFLLFQFCCSWFLWFVRVVILLWKGWLALFWLLLVAIYSPIKRKFKLVFSKSSHTIYSRT